VRGGRLILAVLIVLAGIYWIGSSGSVQVSLPSEDHAHTDRSTFDGYDCTVDCSGHEAGYNWAEEHGITDGDDCDTAGEHSNSPSFAEGCHAYVDGDNVSPADDDSDDSISSDDNEDN